MHHWGFGFWPLIPLFWIGLIVLFCFGARSWSGWRARSGFYAASLEPNSLEILRRRYARGEIDGTTFDQMRERLESSAHPHD